MGFMQRDIRFAQSLLQRRREAYMTQDTSNKAILALKAGGAAESDILKLASWPNIDWERIEGMAKKYGGDFLKELVESLFPTRT